MNMVKMKPSYINNLNIENTFSTRNMPVCSLLGFSLVLLSFLAVSSMQSNDTFAAVDIDTSGAGRAAAYDGEEAIATNGDSFCSITNDIAGGKFSSLFESIVGGGDCDNNPQSLNQFLVEYLYTKNPVKVGEKTYLTITVKDKETGNPISNAFVTLAIAHTPSLIKNNIFGTALSTVVATTPPIHGDLNDKTIQSIYTDNNGHATFTVQLGPKSDIGAYDTEIEVAKDNYQSNFQQTNLHVI